MDFSETRNLLAGENYSTRFFAGVPNIPAKKPEKMSIYLLFIQHIITSLKEKTGRAAIVVPTGFLTASSIGQKIRKHIVDHHMLSAVISMPSNIFANTGTNVSILFLDANGSPEGDALLVDASKLGEKTKLKGTKNQRTILSDGEIKQIIETIQDRQEKEDFSVLVPMEDIKQKKYSFLAGQYFKVKIEYSEMTEGIFKEKVENFTQELSNCFMEDRNLEQKIMKGMEELKYE